MPKTKISEYSSTASNNTDIDGISIAEGMAPSNVNNAIRELMSQLKDWQSGAVAQDMSVNGAFTATGNAVLSADLSVGDDLTVTGDATVGGGFTCTGAAVLSSTLAVAGNASITGTLSATGASSLGAVTCSGAAVMSSTLAVSGGSTLAGVDVSGAYKQTINAVSALDINCSAGNYFTKTINGDSTFTVSNIPSSRAYSFTLELTHTSGAITWFSGVEWPNGIAPNPTTGKTHLFMFITDDGGTRWRGAALLNYTN